MPNKGEAVTEPGSLIGILGTSRLQSTGDHGPAPRHQTPDGHGYENNQQSWSGGEGLDLLRIVFNIRENVAPSGKSGWASSSAAPHPSNQGEVSACEQGAESCRSTKSHGRRPEPGSDLESTG